MTRRRRGIFASFGAGFRDGYNRHSGSRHVRRGYRRSFVERQDAAYHRSKHRRHAAVYTLCGVIGTVILLCYCTSFLGLL